MSLEELKILKKVKVSDNEIKRSKDQLKGNLILSLESSISRMNQLAKQEIYFGRYFSMDEIIAEIEKVRGDNIQSLAKKLLEDSFFNLAILGPVKKGEISLDLLQ